MHVYPEVNRSPVQLATHDFCSMSKNLLFPQDEHYPKVSTSEQSSGRQVLTSPEVGLNRQSVQETVPVG